MIRVLIADDDAELGDLLVEYLIGQGLTASTVLTAEAAIERLALEHADIDVLVLDVMLPGIDGLTALRHIRQHHSLPVLMLSGRGEPVDRVVGLELGADDYLSKPCLPRELLARINALVRRRDLQAGASESVMSAGRLSVFPSSRRVMLGDGELDLTGAEFDVLKVLISKAGTVISRERLTEEGLHRDLEKEDRAIDVHISRLRKKLSAAEGVTADKAHRDAGCNALIGAPAINAVRGAGYILTVPTSTKGGA